MNALGVEDVCRAKVWGNSREGDTKATNATQKHTHAERETTRLAGAARKTNLDNKDKHKKKEKQEKERRKTQQRDNKRTTRKRNNTRNKDKNGLDGPCQSFKHGPWASRLRLPSLRSGCTVAGTPNQTGSSGTTICVYIDIIYTYIRYT